VNDGVNIDTAVILAGGLGTRLRTAVAEVPKPMAPINGRPFLEYQMDFWLKQGIRHFILSIGYKHEVISSYFGSEYGGATIDYVIEDVPMGTGGGLLLSLKYLSNTNPFLLLNGDSFFDVSISNLLKHHLANRAAVTFSLFRTSENERYMGMQLSDDGRILSLGNKNNQSDILANGGVYVVDPIAFNGFPAPTKQAISLESDIFPELLKSEAGIWGHQSNGFFIDIGVPADYFRAQDMPAFKKIPRQEVI
jgi:D-glycero-alpha-D-manno-heptose 1-phosphate guanylyltransferase